MKDDKKHEGPNYGRIAGVGAAFTGGMAAGDIGARALHNYLRKRRGDPVTAKEWSNAIWDDLEKKAGGGKLPDKAQRELEAQTRRRNFKKIEGAGEGSKRKPPKLALTAGGKGAAMDESMFGIGKREGKKRASGLAAEATTTAERAAASAPGLGAKARSYAGAAGNTGKAVGAQLAKWLMKNKGKAGVAGLGLAAGGYGLKKLLGNDDDADD